MAFRTCNINVWCCKCWVCSRRLQLWCRQQYGQMPWQ
jgi:hypothetical protein